MELRVSRKTRAEIFEPLFWWTILFRHCSLYQRLWWLARIECSTDRLLSQHLHNMAPVYLSRVTFFFLFRASAANAHWKNLPVRHRCGINHVNQRSQEIITSPLIPVNNLAQPCYSHKAHYSTSTKSKLQNFRAWSCLAMLHSNKDHFSPIEAATAR